MKTESASKALYQRAHQIEGKGPISSIKRGVSSAAARAFASLEMIVATVGWVASKAIGASDWKETCKADAKASGATFLGTVATWRVEKNTIVLQKGWTTKKFELQPQTPGKNQGLYVLAKSISPSEITGIGLKQHGPEQTSWQLPSNMADGTIALLSLPENR